MKSVCLANYIKLHQETIKNPNATIQTRKMGKKILNKLQVSTPLGADAPAATYMAARYPIGANGIDHK